MSRSPFAAFLPQENADIMLSCHAELPWLRKYYGVDSVRTSSGSTIIKGSEEAISRIADDYKLFHRRAVSVVS